MNTQIQTIAEADQAAQMLYDEALTLMATLYSRSIEAAFFGDAERKKRLNDLFDQSLRRVARRRIYCEQRQRWMMEEQFGLEVVRLVMGS